MDLNERLRELAKINKAPSPVVSVYLNSRWTDEHQRDRVRVFLKNQIKKARQAPAGKAMKEDLSWIETQGELLIDQVQFPEAHGVALFACKGLGLREVLPVGIPLEESFVVADAPSLAPLAALLEHGPSALVVFVDGESARLIPLNNEKEGEEVTLESEVPGRHRRGGWAQLAQSRYQRHINDHRGRHFEAVAETLVSLTEGDGVQKIIMAGEPRIIAAFLQHLPERVAKRVGGHISGARHESSGVILNRATKLLDQLAGETDEQAVNAVLTEAAKSRKAVAGLEETLDAVGRGAVHSLYLLNGFNKPGQVCGECQSFQSEGANCRLCGKTTKAIELAEAVVNRVIASGGSVKRVGAHEGLARVGGLAALLRYPL
jgi:peptide subunit release factor 1 (eRF1)